MCLSGATCLSTCWLLFHIKMQLILLVQYKTDFIIIVKKMKYKKYYNVRTVLKSYWKIITEMRIIKLERRKSYYTPSCYKSAESLLITEEANHTIYLSVTNLPNPSTFLITGEPHHSIYPSATNLSNSLHFLS